MRWAGHVAGMGRRGYGYGTSLYIIVSTTTETTQQI
jgi:hypothetical protein